MGYDVAKNEARYAENFKTLVGEGVNQDWLTENFGTNIENKARAGITSAWSQADPMGANQINQRLQDIGSQQFEFDPQKFLPGIQQTASSIYDPQRQQMQAYSDLQQSQTDQAKVTTREDFARLMTNEVEAINQRGAFFSGGALKAGEQLRTQEATQLGDITMQNQAAQAGFAAQQAGLSAAQAEYVQQKLSGASDSAYSKFQDNRNFMMGLNQAQRNIFESDRSFAQDVKQFDMNYALDKRRVELSEKESEEAGEDSKSNFQHYQVGGKMYTFDPETGQSYQTGSYQQWKPSSNDDFDINNL